MDNLSPALAGGRRRPSVPALSALLLTTAAALGGAAPSPPGRPEPPPPAPPRWWQYYGGLFEQQARSLTLTHRLTEDQAARAEALVAHYRAKAEAAVAARASEVEALAAAYDDLRRRKAEGVEPPAAEWQAMLRTSGELYKPVAALLTEMTAELAALEKSAEPVRRAEESVWATPEQVEAALGGLPTGPDLAAVVNAHLAGRPVGDRERALREAAERRIEARRAERAADWERLTGVIAVVRRNPGAVRTADLDVFRAHWFELLAPLQEEAERLRAELAAE